MQLSLNFFDDDYLSNNLSIVKCDKYKGQGLVYMGSKRFIADYLYHAIKNTLHAAGLNKSGRFVDLFCGGGAIGLCALSHGERVVFNDINGYLIYLLQTAICGKPELKEYLNELKTHFFTKTEYQELKDAIANKSYFEIDCKTALRYAVAMQFWSFGGNFGSHYIYGKDKEYIKNLMHKVFFYQDEIAKKELELIAGFNFEIKKDFTPYENYIYYKKQGREKIGKTRSEKDRRITFYGNKYYLERLQHLEHLEHLEHKENIVDFFSLDYTKMQFNKDDIIYCDPPYENTIKYKHGLNHNSFFEWALSLDNSVFISEYQDLTQYGFIKVFEKEKRALLNMYNNRQIDTRKECLFWNGK